MLFALLGVTGCGSSKATVTGVVSLDGEPVTSGRVAFHKSGQAPAIANISEEGTYRLAVGGSKGIEPGEYTVTVASYVIGKPRRPGDPPPATLVTPPQYVDVTTTPLSSTVVSGRNQIELKLETN